MGGCCARIPPTQAPARRTCCRIGIALAKAISIFVAVVAFNQVVFVGKQPTKAELAKLCEHEYTLNVKNWSPQIVEVNKKLRPNLQLQQATHITGRVTDTPGAPLKRSQVELREYISPRRQVTVKTITTDDDGRFDLGTVQKGKYRLLPSPTRAWKQPTKLECASERCELNIALEINTTDLPDAGCPIR